ncbi:MAG: nucleoside kinase [Bacteroidales bacterium]|nr:nucleoside kinase [Bacteroidales bacterium]
MTKIEKAIEAYSTWCDTIGIRTLEDLKEIQASGRATGLITLCEAKQEREYASIADRIFFNSKERPFVMMSGPSSSGKTSSSIRIAAQCAVLGRIPHVIELDNYFLDRDETPVDENGNKDYESIGAMDVELLNSQLNDLLSGKEIVMPKFDFVKGQKTFDPANTLKLEPGGLVFMEGIHALNPALTPAVDRNRIFNVYISAMSALEGVDVHNSTTDKRLLRRIVRDNRLRGITAEENILRWPSVREGEIKNIFPYEENADVVFNSSMLYDLPLLKYYAEPLLYEIGDNSPAHEKAANLLTFLERITALTPSEIAIIPPHSIMREFIGGQRLY